MPFYTHHSAFPRPHRRRRGVPCQVAMGAVLACEYIVKTFRKVRAVGKDSEGKCDALGTFSIFFEEGELFFSKKFGEGGLRKAGEMRAGAVFEVLSAGFMHLGAKFRSEVVDKLASLRMISFRVVCEVMGNRMF